MQNLKNFFQNKKICLLGFGREGQSSLRYLLSCKNVQDIKIFDDKVFENNLSTHAIIPLKEWAQYANEFDLILKSPGIPWSIDFYRYQTKFSSQVELFLKYGSGKKIGITGSAGKSSTSLFTYDLLQAHFQSVFLGGNYGLPLLDFIDQTNDNTVTVIELSSYQLKHLPLSPEIAVFLNFYPDHLDYHKTLEDYFDSKCQIYKNQSSDQLLVVDSDLLNRLKDVKSIVITTGTTNSNADITFNKEEIRFKTGETISLENYQIRGLGFKQNLCASIAVALSLNMPIAVIQETIKNLKTPPHRLENLGLFQNVAFFNDSIATIPEAILNALYSISEADCLILGGYDRGLDQSKILSYLQKDTKLKAIVCMGQTGGKIYHALQESLKGRIFFTNSLKEAVKIVVDTPSASCCLFSPGAPSFGLFKNFEERGNFLRQIVVGK